MAAELSILKGLAIFDSLSGTQLAAVAGAMVQSDPKAGEPVFREGEPGDSLYVVISGVVEITTRITGDVEKTLIALRTGGVFGELSLLTGDARSATATATADTVLLSLDAAAFESLISRHPAVGRKMMSHLLSVIAGRLNLTTNLYRRAVAWGLDIGNVIQLNFNELITEQIEVAIELASGRTLAGTLLKVEQGPVGYELLLKTEGEQFSIVPYHAVVSVSFAQQAEKAE